MSADGPPGATLGDADESDPGSAPQSAGGSASPGGELDANFSRLAIDLARLSVTPIVADFAAAPSDPSNGALVELAEDMVDVLRRLQAIEAGIAALAAKVEQVDRRVQDANRSLASELAQQRRELLGDRKSVLARGMFNAVVAHLDNLRTMRARLAEGRDKKDKHNRLVVKQLEAIELTLLTAIQGLGFQEFHVTVGDPFTPSTMECLGYAAGEPGIVLRVLRPGFRSTEGVARPAAVMIADPRKTGNATRQHRKETRS